MALNNDKSLAREAAFVRREEAFRSAAATAPGALAAQAFPISIKPGSSAVSGFFPYQSEIDARPLLGRLAGGGWTPCLPVVTGKGQPLLFRRWYPGEPTTAGKWNIPVPLEASPDIEPDVLLVPMLAFDRRGFRLGYGGGFYDRTLARLRMMKPVVAIGVAFSAQEMNSVPHDALDQPVDYVMTEREVFRCA